MNISLQDASDALDTIGAADRQVRQAVWYREAAPFLIMWGLVWMLGNAVTDLWPRFAGLAWMTGTTMGIAGTATIIFLQMRDRAARYAQTPADRAHSGRRILLLGVAVAGFFPAMFAVLGPLSPQQYNAFISLFWAFAYMAAGAFVGMRLFITGALTAVAILAGYLFVQQHFFLWMAVFGGGSLLLAGFWFRKI